MIRDSIVVSIKVYWIKMNDNQWQKIKFIIQVIDFMNFNYLYIIDLIIFKKYINILNN